MPKINIVSGQALRDFDVPGEDVGLFRVLDSTAGMFMSRELFHQLKEFFQSIKFRPGDSVSNTKYPGQELKVIDFNHENYFCIDTATFAPINFPFAEAEAWSNQADGYGFRLGDFVREKGRDKKLIIRGGLGRDSSHYEVSTSARSGRFSLLRKDMAEAWTE